MNPRPRSTIVRTLSLSVAVLSLLLSFGAQAQDAKSCPAEGAKAPPFGFLLPNGQRLSLAAELKKEKPVIVSFWETNCVPCKYELPILQKLSKEWGDQVSFVLIHAGEGDGENGPAKAEAMLKSLGVDLPRAIDTFQMQVKKYCATELPMLFVVDAKGVVRHVQRGADEKFEATIRKTLEKLGVKS